MFTNIYFAAYFSILFLGIVEILFLKLKTKAYFSQIYIYKY